MLPMDSDGADLPDVIPMSVILVEAAVQALSCSALHFPLISFVDPRRAGFVAITQLRLAHSGFLFGALFPVVCWTVL